jgi:hypothetical protein
MEKRIEVVVVDGKMIIQVKGKPDFPVDDDDLDRFIQKSMQNIEEGTMIEKMIEEEA